MGVVLHTSTEAVAASEPSPLRKVFEAIQEIEHENQRKTAEQLEFLKSVRKSLAERMSEINVQFGHIEELIRTLSGAPRPPARKRSRRDFNGVRERMLRWMESRKHQKFGAADLLKQFPEIQGIAVCVFLKPLVDAGLVVKDSSQGNRRTKYFIPGSHWTQ